MLELFPCVRLCVHVCRGLDLFFMGTGQWLLVEYFSASLGSQREAHCPKTDTALTDLCPAWIVHFTAVSSSHWT